MNETATQTELRLERRVEAPPEAVFDAGTHPSAAPRVGRRAWR